MRLSGWSSSRAISNRSAARPEKVGEAWGINAKAYADRIAAALRYFGLLDYQGQTGARSIVVSDEGRKYLRAHQEETKREVIVAAAKRPKQIANFFDNWGSDRPADAACLDELIQYNGFSDSGARDFLKVYDATIAFAGLEKADKAAMVGEGNGSGVSGQKEDDKKEVSPPPPPLQVHRQQIEIRGGERIVFTEESNPNQYLKLVASGDVDDTLLEALEDFVKRQRKRLARSKPAGRHEKEEEE